MQQTRTNNQNKSEAVKPQIDPATIVVVVSEKQL